MRRLIIVVAMAALVLAKPKPETYRETEDFQYARSSSDDGSKSGYYGAQRGNMGGNYERAHNMDLLAQHQMSGLVKQVDGELGEGAKTRTGSVFTAANSRGIYGSGNYDLSNLKGRNFAEGESISNTQASQAYSSMMAHNSGYRGHSYSGMHSSGRSSTSNQAQDSRYSGYQSLGHGDQRYIDNLQTADTSQSLGRYENNNRAGYNSNYLMQYGSHGQSEFDQSSTNIHRSSGLGANTQSRYITTPVKVVLRPGGRVAIPISAPTYDVSQSALSEDGNALNSNVEILNQQTNLKPTNKIKHYESSYSYRKQWEKHHSQPADISVVVPTENPFSINSELHDDVQLLQSAKEQFQDADLQTAHSSNVNSEHRTNAQSAASSSTSQSAFDTQHRQVQSGFNTQQSSASSGTYANNAYRHNAHKTGMTADLTNAVENIDLKPKSYQSSYSYHKSWERKGDPYVIIPSTYDNQASQRLTAASANSAAYSSHHYGSHSKQAQQSYIDCDCDDEGHVRVARSYNPNEELQQQQQNSWDDISQQTQNGFEKLQDLGQQTQSKWENLEDLGQQQQSKWDNLQDLGQQTQNQWDNLQQLGQETQSQWDQFQQVNQENLQNLGQQTQNKWDKLEDLGQHTISDMEQTQNGNTEDFSQHSQKDDFDQQANGADVAEHEKNNTQQESQLNSNNWNQITGFDQSNVQIADTLDETQNNQWFQKHNTNYDDFMRPILVSKDSNAPYFTPIVNEKPNLFPLPLSNNQRKSPWDQSNTQYDFWNSHHYQNLNDFKNNRYEHNIQGHSSSDSGSNLQNLWSKIDDIAGEFSATEDKTDDKHSFSQDSSNFYLNNQNVNYMQNGYSWGDTYPNFQTPQDNAGNIDETKSEHHNLFDDQADISTTTKLNLPTVTNFPSEIAGTSSKTRQDVEPDFDKNIPSPDAGRGDIGPEEASIEIMTTPKSYIKPLEIDNLSLTKEKPDEIIFHPIVMKPKNENIRNTFTVTNNSAHESMKENIHNSIIETSRTRVSTANPNTQIFTTTAKVNSTNQKPTLEVTPPNYHSIHLQNHKPQENVQIPDDVQQENLAQQFEDFNQQSQSSWFSNVALQQGYDQQNLEQLFEVFQEHVTNKPYKTPKEIETLSLTKEKDIIQTDETAQQNARNLKDEDTVSKLSNINLNTQNNQHRQLFSTQQSQITTSTPNTKVSSAKPPKVVELNSKPVTDLYDHIDKEKPVESIEIPADIQQQNLEQQFEDFDQQLQGSWFPSDNMQQGYAQQNTEQQFEIFHQQENLQSPNNFQDFGQQEQSPSQSFEDLQVSRQQNPESQIMLNNFQQNSPPSLNSRETIVSNKLEKSDVQTIPATVETETEKPGFWKSVGSKFSDAKNKVFSWFKES